MDFVIVCSTLVGISWQTGYSIAGLSCAAILLGHMLQNMVCSTVPKHTREIN